MMQAVFISDLHLTPDAPLITQRFYAFLRWAARNTRSVFILGDFFHAWPGDDALDSWSLDVLRHVAWLGRQGVQVAFMSGNRDFLVGERVLQAAGMQRLREPCVLALGHERVLLVHGDGYCTRDRAHQRFRRLTRHRWFSRVFLSLPYAWRAKCVRQVRQQSQQRQQQRNIEVDTSIDVPLMLIQMTAMGVRTVIHGHTHQPGLTRHTFQGETYAHYILSDWDDAPALLCYNKAGFFEFLSLNEV